MSEGTPTTDEIRNGYLQRGGSQSEFARWLAGHDAEVAAKAVEAASDRPAQRDQEALRGAFSEVLRDVAYSCSRVWEAWQYGTMTQDDFSPAWEDDELIDSLVTAALDHRSRQEEPTGEYHNPEGNDHG